MADYKEVGIGIASLLASPNTPNPFNLTLRGQSLLEAANIVAAVLDECGAAGIALEKVELDPALYAELKRRIADDQLLDSNADLHGEVSCLRPSLNVR